MGRPKADISCLSHSLSASFIEARSILKKTKQNIYLCVCIYTYIHTLMYVRTTVYMCTG